MSENDAVAGYNVGDLMKRAIRLAKPLAGKPRWVAVMAMFAVGSSTAAELCRYAELDPDEVPKRKRPPRL